MYRFTLRATRVVAAEPLEASFEVTLTESQVVELDASRGHRFLTFPLGEVS